MSTLDNQAADEHPAGDAAEEPGGVRREAFIPLRKADLGQTLSASLPPDAAAAFGRLCRLLHVLISCRLQATVEELKEAYAPFDPDTDTRRPIARDPASSTCCGPACSNSSAGCWRTATSFAWPRTRSTPRSRVAAIGGCT